jgi:NTE family protein/lysophospholipid hydrolase
VLLSELIEQLRTFKLLSGVGAPLLERIVAVASTEVLEANQSLVTEGEVGEDLYFVQQGSFVVTVLDGETGTEVGRLGPGDVVGEIQLISGGRRTATVRALEKSVVLRLPHAEMDALVIESEPLREALATVISQRLREAALRVALPHAVGSDPDLLDLLCERAAWVRLERNEILWKQGSAANGWYVLVSGELSVFVDKH